MGSWSVSCGISNIAITSGNECAIIPLVENKSEYGGYLVSTLPIYGVYNDYGGMEDIVRDENVELIEKHLGITIDEFVQFLVDGKFTYNRSEINPIIAKLEENNRLEEVSNWRFMWVDKQVLDFMSVSLDKWEKGNFNFGYNKILNLLGFTKIENGELSNYDVKRFKFRYEKGDVVVYSDGNTLLNENNNYIYQLVGGKDYCLDSLIEIPSELIFLKDLTKVEAWKFLDDKEIPRYFKSLFKSNSHYDGESLRELLFNRLDKEGQAQMLIEIEKNKVLWEKYFDNVNLFGDQLAKLFLVKGNLHPMSGRFSPHVLYLTPQCGEYDIHQVILEKFVEINKGYIYNEE